MNNLDVNKLISALENDKNEDIIKEDFKTINKNKINSIKQLHLSENKTIDIYEKLKYYKYVDEIPDMKYGSFIRWVNIRNPEKIKLTNGGIVCEIKVTENGVVVICKNRMNRYFQLNMSESLIYRKLSDQELVLLSALNFINNSK
jgi:hypothetical protein